MLDPSKGEFLNGPGHDERPVDESLKGTRLRVYRLMLKSKSPLGIHDIQRSLRLTSASVAQYHVRKLLELKLIREEGEGYVIDRVVFDNVIRIRRTAIPLQVAYAAFFASSLVAMLTILRPSAPSSVYLFAIIVMLIGLIISLYETRLTLRRL